jgi:DNA-binding NtrC family response regulator
MLEQHLAKEPAKVLLIDDELQVLAAYGRVLRAAGLSVVQVSDTTQLSQVLASNDFDLVISDIRIPRVSGLDVLRTVRQRNPDLPVVLMTAVGDLDSAMQAMEQGALRYLLKPVAPAVLSQTAADAIRLSQMAKIK